jgi:hypothetical protein
MKTRGVVFGAMLCWAAGLAFAGGEKTEQELRAEYHLHFADSLETAGAFQGAILVYKMVAELYPNTTYYASAVRNLGYLYINPFNDASNDSLALFWFARHLEISWLPRGERTRSVIISSLVRERMNVTNVETKRLQVIDSLTTVSRIQASELELRAKKIAELQSELEQTDNDLQILLEFQKNPTVARQDTLNRPTTLNAQKIAEAADLQQSKDRSKQSADQLQKLREIDLRALQRRTKR